MKFFINLAYIDNLKELLVIEFKNTVQDNII